MLKFFGSRKTKEIQAADFIQSCIYIFEKSYKEISDSSIRNLRHTNNGELKKNIDKDSLFAFIFIFMSKAYLDLSKEDDIQKILAMSLDSMLHGLLPDGLNGLIISIEISSLYQENIEKTLSDFLNTPILDMNLINVFIHHVFKIKGKKLSKVRIMRALINSLTGCYWFAGYDLQNK